MLLGSTVQPAQGLRFISGSEDTRDGAGTSLIVQTPAGAQLGDLLVMLATADDPADTFTTPAGWTSRLSANGRAIMTLASYDGSTANYTFTFTSTTTRIQILCFRAAVWGVVGTPSASVDNPVAPSITINEANSLWLAFASSTDANVVYATPSGFSDIVPARTSTVSQKIIVNDSVQPTGATSSITFTRTSGINTGRANQFSVSPIPPYTFSYQASYADVSSATTRTISSVDFGAATSSTREIFVVLRWSNSTATTITSATIGGVSATISAGASAGAQGAALIFATVPTGTSGNVVITYSNATTASVAFVYRVTGRPNRGSTAINTYGDTGAVSRSSYTSPTVAIPNNGFVLTILSNNSTTDLTFSGSGITINGDVYSDSNNRVGASINNLGQSSSSRTYDITWGGASAFTLSRIWTFN